MGSPASSKYREGVRTAREIRAVLVDVRLRPMTRDKAQTFAHASLAAHVAAWDAYLNQLARDFYAATARPGSPAYMAMHMIAKAQHQEVERRFNTPNYENSREFLLRVTGLDPISCWVWPRRHMGAQQVKERLNQILKVRHGFAHGVGIPAYPWNRTPTGRLKLNTTVLREVDLFFDNLVTRTDGALLRHLHAVYGLSVPW